MSEPRQPKISHIPLKSSPFGQNLGIFSPVPKISQVCGHWGNFLRLIPKFPGFFGFSFKKPQISGHGRKKEGAMPKALIVESVFTSLLKHFLAIYHFSTYIWHLLTYFDIKIFLFAILCQLFSKIYLINVFSSYLYRLFILFLLFKYFIYIF